MSLATTVTATVQLLMRPAFTSDDLQIATGWHKNTAQHVLQELRAAGIIYIHRWLPDTLGRDAIPVFKKGNKPDKKRRAIPTAQRVRKHRERIKQERKTTNLKGLP